MAEIQDVMDKLEDVLGKIADNKKKIDEVKVRVDADRIYYTRCSACNAVGSLTPVGCDDCNQMGFKPHGKTGKAEE